MFPKYLETVNENSQKSLTTLCFAQSNKLTLVQF